ncbi:hypothetical protein QFZ68_007788 [Streptomyces sp. V1I6]|nr:hypothetical protein [Streptomyces sp. V1I6]
MGGDWFDVIPLPGARVSLVVGDVVGHGLHAAATMGRLRTAVHNFSALDLPPYELLAHLDELVTRIDQDEAGGEDGTGITEATCLYAIYDPVSGHCTAARAGHVGPALVRPDGTVAFPDVPVSLPLGPGLGGEPFETAELQLTEEGSSLGLYTDGLVEDRSRVHLAALPQPRQVPRCHQVGARGNEQLHRRRQPVHVEAGDALGLKCQPAHVHQPVRWRLVRPELCCYRHLRRRQRSHAPSDTVPSSCGATIPAPSSDRS